MRAFADTVIRSAVHSRAAALLLAVPVCIALYFRAEWMIWFGIPTPDHSFIPELASLVGFGTAFVFGWLAHRQVDLLQTWKEQWALHLACALGATAVCIWIAGATPTFVATPRGFEKLAFAFCYGLAIWCWSFAVIGVAMRFLAHANDRVRYIADASFWIYLVHLPVVAAMQVLLGHLPWHWSVKFPLILIVSFAVLFLSYRILVRPTFIGQLLNGRKYPRASRRHAAGQVQQMRLDSASPDASPAMADPGAETELVASLAGVHKRYGKTVALAGLDLDVRRGELLAVLGPNGAGKSTAVSLWLGLLEPEAGSVHLFGGSPLDPDRRRRVGVMMQEVGLTPELRVRELVELTASYYPEPLPLETTLTLTRLGALADRTYSKLSAGQKRQVQFAVAICGRPSLLFLDEPTVGLDVEARESMWRTIRELIAQGCSIVLTTHYLEEAEALADRVAVVASGRLIASGSVAEVRSLVSRKQISCSSGIAEDEIRSWPDVVAVTRDARRLQITVVDAETVVRRLLAADADVRDLEIRQAGLAEAFTELTKEAA